MILSSPTVKFQVLNRIISKEISIFDAAEAFAWYFYQANKRFK